MEPIKVEPLKCPLCGSTSVFKERWMYYCNGCCKKYSEKTGESKPWLDRCPDRANDPKRWTGDYTEDYIDRSLYESKNYMAF